MFFGFQQVSIGLLVPAVHRRDQCWAPRALLHSHLFQNVCNVECTGHNQRTLRRNKAPRLEVTVTHASIHNPGELQPDLILEPHEAFHWRRAVEVILVKLNQDVDGVSRAKRSMEVPRNG